MLFNNFYRIFKFNEVKGNISMKRINPFKRQRHKIVKHTQTIRNNSSAICQRLVWVCLTILGGGWRLKG